MKAARALLLVLAGTAFPVGVAAYHYYGKAIDYQKSLAARTPAFEADPTTGFKLRAGLSENDTERAPLLTDARGARIAKGERPPGSGAIFAAGCSFTFGLNVPAEVAYPAQLAKQLGYPVYNLGVSGYGTVGSFLRVKQFIDLKPRAVVYAFIDDHFDRNVVPCAWSAEACRPVPHIGVGPRLVPADTSGNDYAHLQYIETRHALGWRDVAAAVRRDWAKATGTDVLGLNSAALAKIPREFRAEALVYTLNLWTDLAEKEGFDLYLVHVSYISGPNDLLRSVLQAMAKRPRFHFVDAAPRLMAYKGPGSVRISPEDAHPSEVGHRLIAEAIAEAIRATAPAFPRSSRP